MEQEEKEYLADVNLQYLLYGKERQAQLQREIQELLE